MLLKFKVGNFLSFNEVQTFDMIPTNDNQHQNHITKIGGENVSRLALIYGANASGKTNLLNAIQYAQSIVSWENSKISDLLPKYRNRDLSNFDNRYKDSFFEFEFLVEGRHYLYGFTINTLSGKVIKEYAYVMNMVKECIYECNHKNNKIQTDNNEIDREFKCRSEGLLLKSICNKGLSDECLIIKKSFDMRILMDDEFIDRFVVTEHSINWLTEAMKKMIPTISDIHFGGMGDDPFTSVGLYLHYLSREEYSELLQHKSEYIPLNVVLKRFTLIVTYSRKGFVVDAFDDERTFHYSVLMIGYNGYSVPVNDESMGLIRLMKYLIVLYKLIEGTDECIGSALLIDEIERELHPMTSSRLIEMFYELTDGKMIQMIATTHESLLLDDRKIRSDEIWFAESEPNKRNTVLYPMKKFRINDSEDYDYSYLKGRFGAIPYFGPL